MGEALRLNPPIAFLGMSCRVKVFCPSLSPHCHVLESSCYNANNRGLQKMKWNIT